MRPFTILMVLVLAGACASGDGGEGFRIHGRLLDAETGEPVSRDSIYCHFFHDPADVQRSLDPTSGAEYEVTMPEAEVRVRIADTSDEYRLFEETITLTEPVTRLDVRLKPTHYVLLVGKVVDAKTGRAIRPGADGGHGPLLYASGPDGFGKGPEWLSESGAFALRVPRGPIEFSAVDTAKRIQNPKLDLTGYEGDEREFDLLFE